MKNKINKRNKRGMKMIEFSTRLHVYLDEKALCDEDMDILLGFFAEKHKQMRLVAKNAWDLEETKKSENYGYICDTLYGTDFMGLVTTHMKQHRVKDRAAIVITYEDIKEVEHRKLCIITLGKTAQYTNISDFLMKYQEDAKRNRFILYSIMIACVIYYVWFFCMFSNLPTFMVEGFTSFLFAFIPFAILFLTYVKACMLGLASGWSIFDLFF